MEVHPDGGGCVLANSGMPFPYLVRAGEVTRLPASGVPLGLIEGTSYDEHPFRMERGDLLVLTSDGATDAMDPGGNMYEEQRLIESIRSHAGEDTGRFARSLYRSICEFTRSADVNDDITILALRRTAEN
jgi:sigma-B regulation protein RsbU (phosphoserine phosphatase)